MSTAYLLVGGVGRVGTLRPFARDIIAMVTACLSAGFLVASVPEDARSCTYTTTSEFTHGITDGWEIQTAVDDDTSAWHVTDDPILDGWVAETEAHGLGVKDDRLVSPPFVPTATSDARLLHSWALGDGDGALVELSTDGGATWSSVPAAAVSGIAYDGTAPNGAPAWTGAQPRTYAEAASVSWIDLAHAAGTEIRLGFRLLQDGSGAAPGHRWIIEGVTWFDIENPGCIDGRDAEPWQECAYHHEPDLDALPAGWRIDTPVNEDGTARWRYRGSFAFLNGGLSTDATGRGAKDDRLTSAPFTPSPRTSLRFRHGYGLEDGRDGGVIEISADDGATWTVLEPGRYISGSPEGQLADGTPAWTGTSLVGDDPTPSAGFEPTRPVNVRLGDFAGQRVQVRWRLLQDAQRTSSTPGHSWSVDAIEFRWILDDDCLDGGPATERPVDGEPWWGCTDLTTDHAGVAGATDDGEPIELAVHVLVDTDGIGEIEQLRRSGDPVGDARYDELIQRAAATVEPARLAYDPVGIELEFSYELLMPLDAAGQPRVRTDDINELTHLAKEQYGGRRPAGTDVVYVLADGELQSGGDGAVAGRADCVGGVRYPDKAFAVGEWDSNAAAGLAGQASFFANHGAKIAAHEIAHLLGAHHHYASCVEGVSSQPTEDAASVCTLMINDLSLASLDFSTLNQAVVRGYADAYAR